MIICLSGGLGNQMFQYAFGLSIQISRKWVVFYDKNCYKHLEWQRGTTQRNFELDVFNLELKDSEEILFFRFLNGNSLFQRFINYALKKIRLIRIQKETEEFVVDDLLLSKIRPKSIISGYFQTADYFDFCQKEIRLAFTFRNDLSQNSLNYLTQIEKTNSVSLHVRRGDYVSVQAFSNIHGVCSEEYYVKAIDYIKSRVDNACFFIFSDDIEWVQEQNWVQDLNCVFVNGNVGNRSFEDMKLMSNCLHNIVANSSFSWWGAWLNDNVNKIVIAPKKWFLTDNYDTENSHLIPNSWVKF